MSASIRPTQSAIQMAKNLDLSLDMQRDFGASGSNFTTTGTTIAGSTTKGGTRNNRRLCFQWSH